MNGGASDPVSLTASSYGSTLGPTIQNEPRQPHGVYPSAPTLETVH